MYMYAYLSIDVFTTTKNYLAQKVLYLFGLLLYIFPLLGGMGPSFVLHRGNYRLEFNNVQRQLEFRLPND